MSPQQKNPKHHQTQMFLISLIFDKMGKLKGILVSDGMCFYEYEFLSLVILWIFFFIAHWSAHLYSAHKDKEPWQCTSYCVPILSAESLARLLSLQDFEMLSALVEIFSVVNITNLFYSFGIFVSGRTNPCLCEVKEKTVHISLAQVKWKLGEYWSLLWWSIFLV